MLSDKTAGKLVNMRCGGTKIKVTRHFVFVDCGEMIYVYMKANFSLLTRINVMEEWDVIEVNK